MKQVISILLRWHEDSLVRLTGLLYRRGCLVESLSAAPVCQQGYVRVMAVVHSHVTSEQLLSHISKLIDVEKAEVYPDEKMAEQCMRCTKLTSEPDIYSRLMRLFHETMR